MKQRRAEEEAKRLEQEKLKREEEARRLRSRKSCEEQRRAEEERKLEEEAKRLEQEKLKREAEQRERAAVAERERQQQEAQRKQREAEEAKRRAEAAARAAQQKLIDDWKARIQAKIKGRVVVPANMQGNPEARFEVVLLPGRRSAQRNAQEIQWRPGLRRCGGACDHGGAAVAGAERDGTVPGELSRVAPEVPTEGLINVALIYSSSMNLTNVRLDKPFRDVLVLAGLTFCLACARGAAAQLTIEIIGGGANQIPVTILPLAGEERFIQRISQIVAADLQRSGMFRLGSVGSVRPFPAEPSDINYRYWKNEGAETLVIGSVIEKVGRSCRSAISHDGRCQSSRSSSVFPTR